MGHKTNAVVLGIESSCDDTAAAVCINGKIHSNVVSTQLRHAAYGGVIPELASRMHQTAIGAVVTQALADAKVGFADLTAIAFTAGPGLMGALLVGTSYAKGLALGLGVPLVQVNHLHAHLCSVFLSEPAPALPLLVLTVSGGHTQLQVVKSPLDYSIVGRTLDDAVGEAYDKSAKLLGFDYPGGPLLDKLSAGGDPHAHSFAMPRVQGLDFSYSGLKTSILYYLRHKTASDPDFVEKNKADLAASINHTLVQSLLEKIEAAAKEYNLTRVGIVGGVAANSLLRTKLLGGAVAGVQAYFPPRGYCTDNAAMVALTGHYLQQAGQHTSMYAEAFASSRG